MIEKSHGEEQYECRKCHKVASPREIEECEVSHAAEPWCRDPEHCTGYNCQRDPACNE